MPEKLCLSCFNKIEEKDTKCPHCGYSEGTPVEKPYMLVPGTVLSGKYIVGKAVGYGGFGITYAGYDLALEKKIAIKEYMPVGYATRENGKSDVVSYSEEKKGIYNKGLEKFIDESRRLARLKDTEGVVSVYDVLTANNTAYIIMEYLDGVTLKEYLKSKGDKIENGNYRLPMDTAIGLIVPILGALGKIHNEKLIHRDISPDNIFVLKDGRVKLIDFGAARYVDNDEKSLSVILKHGFAPPEQYSSKGNQGPWTDIYACAATLYLMITGVLPSNSLNRQNKDNLVCPSRLGVKISATQENALMNALNLPVEKRTQSAEQLIRELTGEGKVERVEVKKEKKDSGKTPTWLKVTIGVAMAAILTVIILFASGIVGGKKSIKTSNSLKDDEVRVPNVVNMDVKPAKDKLEDTPLSMQISGKNYSDEIPKNLVLSQSLDSGSVAKRNTMVDLTVSAGVIRDHMPLVVGLKKDDAVAAIKNLKTKEEVSIKIEETESAVEPGCIVSQSLKKGDLVKKNDEVIIVVSQGRSDYDSSVDTQIPEFKGKSWEKAVEEAENSHVYVHLDEYVYDETVPVGDVIKQDIKEGTEAKEGEKVGLTISLGKEIVYVPDVQYKEKEEAIKELESLGLKAETKEIESEIVAEGHVVEQDVEEDTEVEKGSMVRLYISIKVDETDARPDYENWESETVQPTGKIEITTEPTIEPDLTIEPTIEPEPTITAEPTELVECEPRSWINGTVQMDLDENSVLTLSPIEGNVGELPSTGYIFASQGIFYREWKTNAYLSGIPVGEEDEWFNVNNTIWAPPKPENWDEYSWEEKWDEYTNNEEFKISIKAIKVKDGCKIVLNENSGGLFYDLQSLEQLDLNSFDFSKVKLMSRMFYYCPNLKIINMSSANLSSLQRVTELFSGCSSLEEVITSDSRILKLFNDRNNVDENNRHITYYWIDNNERKVHVDQQYYMNFTGMHDAGWEAYIDYCDETTLELFDIDEITKEEILKNDYAFGAEFSFSRPLTDAELDKSQYSACVINDFGIVKDAVVWYEVNNDGGKIVVGGEDVQLGGRYGVAFFLNNDFDCIAAFIVTHFTV